MPYNMILFAGIGAAIGGVLGHFISNRLKGETARLVGMLAPVVVAAIIGAIGGSFIPEKTVEKTPFETASQKHVQKILDNPKFMEAIKGKSAAEITAFSQEKTRLGIKRLSFPELQEWNSLRSMLAENDAILCATFWTGKGLTQDTLVSALNKMPEEKVDAWFRISMTAANMEINESPVEMPDSNVALAGGFKHILDNLNPTDKERFEKIMNGGVEAQDDDACWAAKILFKDITKMDAQLQEAFLRTLAAL